MHKKTIEEHREHQELLKREKKKPILNALKSHFKKDEREIEEEEKMKKSKEDGQMGNMMFGMFHKPIMDAMTSHPVFKSLKKHLMGEEDEGEEEMEEKKMKKSMGERTRMPKEDRKKMAILVMKKKMNGNEE